MTDKELLNIAYEAMHSAYAPHSGFSVGAALECMDGTVYTGCNVENSALGCTICAERNAISSAVAAGHTGFRRIAIVPSGGDDFCTPCGTCRQVMVEFSPEMEILCAKPDGRYASYKASELLPHYFKLDRK